MAEEFQSSREVGLAIEAMCARIVALRDQLTDIKWVLGGFATVAVAAFGYFYITTKEVSITVARIDEHLKSNDAYLKSLDKRLDSIETGMDKRFDAVDKRFEAVDKRFDAVDKRFEAVDMRFDAVDARFDALELRMDKRFDALTTLILNLQPPLQKRTEGFRLVPQ
jgi:flagellar capping protein FliD